jgi:hypothetical protein
MIDCDEFTNGCEGGLTENALLHLETNFLMTKESYPYRESDAYPCRYTSKAPFSFKDGKKDKAVQVKR